MRHFKNILLYYNDEFAGIKANVIRLVKQNQAKLKIISIIDKFDQYSELLPPSGSIDELKEIITSERGKEIINHFQKDSDIHDQITVIFKFGNPVVETIREVITADHDLVVKAASGNKSLKDRLFGNIAAKLLRKCPCPVLILKPSETVSFKKIIAPVDPVTSEDPSDQVDPLCKKVMDISLNMAKKYSSHLTVLHCWELPGETLLSGGRTRIDPDKLNQMRNLAEKMHTQKINKFVAGFDTSDIKHSIIVKNGDPGDTIVGYADRKSADLIIMGTIGRSGLSGFLMGSTAEKVISRVNCSVLTVKPENFKSPIIIK